MYIFGLTGGIASGKSTVSRHLQGLGCPVIDADIIARQGNFLKYLFHYNLSHTLNDY